MDFKLSIPERVIDAFAVRFGYSENIGDEDNKTIPNPQSKGDFFIETLNDWIVGQAQSKEIETAKQEAEVAVRADFAKEVSLSIKAV
jgi:hypothetical protein